MIICWWRILLEAVMEMVNTDLGLQLCTLTVAKFDIIKKHYTKYQRINWSSPWKRKRKANVTAEYTLIISNLRSFWNKITKWPNLVACGGCAHRWRTLINLVLRWNLQFSISVSFSSVVNARVLVVIFLLTSPLPSLLAVTWQSVFYSPNYMVSK